MSFQLAEDEIRARFTETFLLLNQMRSRSPVNFTLADDATKALRGLWLVSLYAAVERSINSIVEQSIFEISSHSSPSKSCNHSIFSVFHYSHLKSIKDCSYKNVFEKSIALFSAALNETPLNTSDNPLAELLQNVDADTIQKVIVFFGAPTLVIASASSGRLTNLRERRNAVAHGREAASFVGSRFTMKELDTMYNLSHEVIINFYMHMKEYCEGKKYLNIAA